MHPASFVMCQSQSYYNIPSLSLKKKNPLTSGIFLLHFRSWNASKGECARHTCSRSPLEKGRWEVWTERCEAAIRNPQYTCVVESEPGRPFPHCCPRPTECRDEVKK